MMPLVEGKIDHFLHEKLSSVFPMISMFIGQNTINQLKLVFMQELESMFPEIIGAYMKNIESQLDLEEMVTKRLLASPVTRWNRYSIRSCPKSSGLLR